MSEEQIKGNFKPGVNDTGDDAKEGENLTPCKEESKLGANGDSKPSLVKPKTFKVSCSHCDTDLANAQTAEQAEHILQVHEVSCKVLNEKEEKKDTENEQDNDKHILKIIAGILVLASVALYAFSKTDYGKKFIANMHKKIEEKRKKYSDKTQEENK